MKLQYRIEWPNDARHDRVKNERFPTKEAALGFCRIMWAGSFELHLKADAEPGHYYCAPLHVTEPGRSSPRIIPIR
jgi:hypothetical protein